MNEKRRLLGLVMASLLFTSTAYAFAVYGAIGAKWQALNGARGPLGDARSDEAAAQYGGRFNRFEHGFIYWHPETGAHAVYGAIGQKWAQLGFENYGYPLNDESMTPDRIGRYNHFRAVHRPGKPEASIYWTPQYGPMEIYGAIRQKWAEMGWERSSLGYPTSREYLEYQGSPVKRQDFQRGALWWSPTAGVQLQPIVRPTPPPPAQPPQASNPTPPPSTPSTPQVRYCTSDCNNCSSAGLQCSLNSNCSFANYLAPWACY